MRKNRKGQIHNEFRLLVLDDDEMITLALRAYFEGCGYTVDIESNPLRAIEKIRLDHYDILLLDFLMNPICGDKVVEEIQQVSESEYDVLGSANVQKLFDLLDINEELDVVTASGWVMEAMGRVPEEGDEFDDRNLHVKVTRMDGKRIEQIRVTVAAGAAPA